MTKQRRNRDETREKKRRGESAKQFRDFTRAARKEEETDNVKSVIQQGGFLLSSSSRVLPEPEQSLSVSLPDPIFFFFNHA